MSVIPDSAFGRRVRDRLRDEKVAWFTTVGGDGTPQPNPVWFLWDEADDTVLIYNAYDAYRLAHVAVRPRVSLNLESDPEGNDVVVLAGVAEQAADVPSPDRNEAYLAKYADDVVAIGMDTDSFAQKYSVPLRIRIGKVRGF
jgi:PPOX class probable F420-dependent enzyme